MGAGAVALCCAKLGEAEALAAGGLDRLTLTSPVRGRTKLDRMMRLAPSLSELIAVVDDPAHAVELNAAAGRVGYRLDVLIDVDVGRHRFGVPTVEAARDLALMIGDLQHLRLRGIQGYAGHVQHIIGYEERRQASHDAMARLQDVSSALTDLGHPPEIVTGSGTGTHDIDADLGLMTDLQVGSYIVSDVQYDVCQSKPGEPRRYDNALFVETRVVSAHHAGFVTTDAGSKSFSVDGPMPVIVSGAPEGSRYSMFGDEFGRIELPPGSECLSPGTLVRCIVPHCDPTINLYDHFTCVRDGRIVDHWKIEARGCST